MKIVKGTIRGGRLRFDNGHHLPKNARVVIVVIPRSSKPVRLSKESEDEELQFVRGCRKRLSRIMKAVDGRNGA